MPGFRSKSTNASPVWLADDDGNPIAIGGGSGGGGDASAANQTTEIARLTSIRDTTGAVGDTAYADRTGAATGTVVAILKGVYVLFARAFGFLPAGTNRSGTATTTSGGLNVPANSSRYILLGQNVGTVNIGYNEFGGTAAIGSAGTYTVTPGSSFNISTSNQINFIAASGTPAVTMTEI